MDPPRSIASRLLRSLKDRFFPSDLAPHLAKGVCGEKRAAHFLRSQGMKILRRNFRAKGGGEIDIVCRDGEVLVFVEVKSRSSDAFGRPSSAVDSKKRRLIKRAALTWLRLLDMPEIAFRFDIVEVIDGEVPRHIPGAFSLPRPFHY